MPTYRQRDSIEKCFLVSKTDVSIDVNCARLGAHDERLFHCAHDPSRVASSVVA